MNNNQSPSNNLSSKLIVDFPTQIRDGRLAAHKKSVRIAPFSSVRIFRLQEHESDMKSYSKADYRRFKMLRDHDIVECSDLVARKMRYNERLTHDDMCMCTGLEMMLSPDVPRRIEKLCNARLSHLKKVLSAQKKGYSVDDIASVSIASSKMAVARSHSVAATSFALTL